MSGKLWLFFLFLILSLTLCLSTPALASDACSPTSPNPEAATVRIPDVGVPLTPASGVADGWVLLYKDPEFKQLSHEVYCKNNKIQFATSPGKKKSRRNPDCTKTACTQAVETGQATNIGLRSPAGVANHFLWGVHPDVACNLTPNSLTVLYSFNYGASYPGYDTFSTGPKLLGDSLGNLYGANPQGGKYGMGTVFEFSCPSTMTVLHAFDYNSSTNKHDGSQPFGSPIFDTAGNLYGTTRGGGTPSSGNGNNGMIYELLAPLSSTSSLNQLAAFNGSSPIGSEPYSGVVFDTAGNLYGSAYSGGSGYGSIYKLSGSTLSTLTTFASGQTPPAGHYPIESDSLAMDSAGNLYGTNSTGGAHNGGTVFKVSPAGVETTLWTFTGGADGAEPFAAPILDSSGNLYGTAVYGGANSGGTIWKIPYLGGGQYGALTVLFSFDDGNDYGTNGSYPQSGLVMDAAGNLYGTTNCGGTGGADNCNSGSGVLFQLSPSGTFTPLYNFNRSWGADGAQPVATPLLAADGNLYGITTNDGTNGVGSLWGFGIPQSAETLSITPGTGSTGAGTVTGPSGISCPGTCSAQLTAGTQVTLTATPASGSTFGGWGGACSGTATTCTITMNNPQGVGVTYTFTLVSEQLSVTVAGTGTGTVTSVPSGVNCTGTAGTDTGTCSPSFGYDTSVTLTAVPATGSVFSSWSGACTGTATTCTVTMSAAESTTATFTYVGTSTLTVAVTGSGTVTDSIGAINCPSTCSAPFTLGQQVTLTATPGSGYEFNGWGGACSGYSYTCTVAVNAATSVSALFVAAPSGFSLVYGFSGSVTLADGGKPMSNLIPDGKGNFYGTTYFGGTNGIGSVYMLSPTGSSNCSSARPTIAGNGFCMVNLYSFTSSSYYPYGGLVMDPSGNLYGDTSLANNNGSPSVFELNPSNLSNIVFTTLSSIPSYQDGGLVMDSSGYLYGIAPNGGPSHNGAVYKVDPTQTPAVESIVGYTTTSGMWFEDYGPAAMDSAGNFYGTSELAGGNSGDGTIWEVTKSGTFKVLYTFTNTANANDGNTLDGEEPAAAPIVDAAGNLYGTTTIGGANGGGTIWELSRPTQP